MERLSSPDKKKVYYGLDLLKLIMAFIVVMIHVKPFPAGTVLYSAFSPLLAVAVPVFFVISAFLLFSKTYGSNSNVGGGAFACYSTIYNKNIDSLRHLAAYRNSLGNI